MNEKEICSRLRPVFGSTGLALLIYYGIMNVCVVLAMFVQAIASIVLTLLQNPDAMLSDETLENLLDSLMSNGWGYLIATLLGAVLLLAWKKKDFCFRTIWQSGAPMKAGSFVMLLTVFLSAQAIVQLTAGAMEWFFNLFDMSIADSLESMSGSTTAVSMLLYAGFAAPVFEEILFRGLVLRTLQPYGKKFAIFGSAFLFGIFHGNILQSPFAFAVGLVLGYVTVEYSIGWAIVLHMINNLVLGDILPKLLELLKPWAEELIFSVIIYGSLLAAIVILIVKRREVAAYFGAPKIHPLCLKSFFTSPGVLVLTVIMGLNIVLSFLMMFLGQAM